MLLNKTLNWFQLIDQDNKFSLTSFVLYALLIKTVMMPEIDVAAVGLMMVALLNLGHKRFVNDKARKDKANRDKEEQAETNLMKKVNKQMEELKQGQLVNNHNQDTLSKALADLGDQVTNISLAIGFNPNLVDKGKK